MIDRDGRSKDPQDDDADPQSRPGHKPDPEALSHMVDAIEAAARDGRGDLGSLIAAAGPRGTVPVMTVVALLIVSPLSGIPFVSSVCGLTITLCALQAALGRSRVWLPNMLKRRRANPDRVVRALHRMRSVATWLERRASSRLLPFSRRPFSTAFLLIAATYGGAMPFLELVPMSSSLLALGVTLIGLGLMLRDGVLLLISLVPPGVAVWIVWSIWVA